MLLRLSCQEECQPLQNQVALKMNPERSPKTARTVKLTIRFTSSQLREIDEYCAENGLTRSHAVRRILKAAYLQRAIGRGRMILRRRGTE